MSLQSIQKLSTFLSRGYSTTKEIIEEIDIVKTWLTNLSKINIHLKRVEYSTLSAILGLSGINVTLDTGFTAKDVVKLDLEKATLGYYGTIYLGFFIYSCTKLLKETINKVRFASWDRIQGIIWKYEYNSYNET